MSRVYSNFCSLFVSYILLYSIFVFFSLAKELGLQVLIFDGFGKEFIKSCNISPDGFVQLTLQLAYYRFFLFHQLVNEFEEILF